MTSDQLFFRFSETSDATSDTFLPSECNRAALQFLSETDAWPAHALLLHGPEKCGKTHLARAWAAHRGAAILQAQDLDRDAVLTLPPSDIAVEDIEALSDETALFHLYNLTRESEHRLLLTARTGPGAWAIALPDLASRIRATPEVGIDAPDDALVEPLLTQLCAAREMPLRPATAAWIARRIGRSYLVLNRAVALLETAVLAEKGKLTVPLASRVLEPLLNDAGEGDTALD